MINVQRLLDRLHRLREFGRRGKGVVRRCLSDADMASRHWLQAEMQSAGLDAAIDGVANVFGCSANTGPAVLLASHTDTQPTGGWLDGALGVIYGLEVAQSLHENPATEQLAIDVASWSDEESHYLGLLGSRSFCGLLADSQIDTASNDDGLSLRAALATAGLGDRPRLRLEAERYAACIEAHIEQGPWLEKEGLQIGVVTGIVGMRDLTLRFRGQQNHAGTTPMHLRRDAAQALFDFNTAINQRFAEVGSHDSVWTLGQLRIEPFARSIVPGLAEANLQFRDPDQTIVDALQTAAFELAEAFGQRAGIEVEISIFDDSANAVDMDPKVQLALATVAEKRAPGAWRYLPSGAAHDAQVLAEFLPTGMLFIPSIGGVSHDFTEDSHEADIVLGCEVLADACLELISTRIATD